jgi:repressor LexA
LRERERETQADLARLLGVTPEAIGHYEKGRSKVDIIDLQKLAKHFAVPLAYFLDASGPETSQTIELQRLTNQTQRLLHEVEELGADYMRNTVLIPLLGTVPGGSPGLREEEPAEVYYPIRRADIHAQGAFCLKVTGNSMAGRGIIDGDIVFVDRNRTPADGDIVIARRDDEAVIRVFRRDADGPYLEAANDGYPRLRLQDGEIKGVVVKSQRDHK